MATIEGTTDVTTAAAGAEAPTSDTPVMEPKPRLVVISPLNVRGNGAPPHGVGEELEDGLLTAKEVASLIAAGVLAYAHTLKTPVAVAQDFAALEAEVESLRAQLEEALAKGATTGARKARPVQGEAEPPAQ